MPYTPVVPLSHPSCPGFQIAGPSGYLRHLTTYTDVSTRLAWLEERSVRLLASGGRMAIVRKPRSAPVDARAALERSGIWLPDGVTVPGGDTDA